MMCLILGRERAAISSSGSGAGCPKLLPLEIELESAAHKGEEGSPCVYPRRESLGMSRWAMIVLEIANAR